MKIPRHPL